MVTLATGDTNNWPDSQVANIYLTEHGSIPFHSDDEALFGGGGTQSYQDHILVTGSNTKVRVETETREKQTKRD